MAKLVRRRWTSSFEGMSRRDREGCTYDAYVPDPLAGWNPMLTGRSRGRSRRCRGGRPTPQRRRHDACEPRGVGALPPAGGVGRLVEDRGARRRSSTAARGRSRDRRGRYRRRPGGGRGDRQRGSDGGSGRPRFGASNDHARRPARRAPHPDGAVRDASDRRTACVRCRTGWVAAATTRVRRRSCPRRPSTSPICSTISSST